MAKKKAAAVKKLMPAGKVVVTSRAYGEHERAVRGSKTPVAINEVLQRNVAKTVVVTAVAKRVHDLLRICGAHFKARMLWQEMLSRMRLAASTEALDLLGALQEMELNGRYPLKRFAQPQVKDVKWDKKGCEIMVSRGYPDLQLTETEYCYEAFLLTLGKEAKEDGLMSSRSEWMKANDKEGEIVFVFAVTVKVAYYVVCLHFMTGKNGKETGIMANRGMRIADAGKGNADG